MGARICHKFLGAGTALFFLLCGLSISGVRAGAAGGSTDGFYRVGTI